MTRTEEAHLFIEALSHPGLAGKKNEDRYGVSALKTGPHQKTPAVLAVLCDGIGGHRAGEVAAEMGVSIITETIEQGDDRQPLKLLSKAISHANQAIYEASQTDYGRNGMGTTCVCAWVIGDRLYTVNLGDSRIYLLRDGHIVQLTTDHTWVQEALDAKIITDEDYARHPNAHVIRRYLGSKKSPQPDFRLWFFEGEQDSDALKNQGMQLKPDDILLLCSDGLTDLVSDEEIRTAIMDNPLKLAPQVLIDKANSRGGHDNATVVVMKVPPQSGTYSNAVRRRRWLMGCLAGFTAIALLIIIVIFGVRWRGRMVDELTPVQPVTYPTIPLLTPSPVILSPTLGATETMERPVDRHDTAPTITPWPTNTSVP